MIYYALRLNHSENVAYLHNFIDIVFFSVDNFFCSGERSFIYYTYVKGVVSFSHLSNFQRQISCKVRIFYQWNINICCKMHIAI